MIRKYNVALHLEDSVEETEIIVRKTAAKVLIVPHPWNESQSFRDPRIKYFGSFRQANGVWPLIKFLAGSEAGPFLDNVAQS